MTTTRRFPATNRPRTALGIPARPRLSALRHRPRPRDEIRETWLRERRGARVRGEGGAGQILERGYGQRERPPDRGSDDPRIGTTSACSRFPAHHPSRLALGGHAATHASHRRTRMHRTLHRAARRVAPPGVRRRTLVRSSSVDGQRSARDRPRVPDSAALGRLVAGPRASASLPHEPAGSGAMSARRTRNRTVRCPTGTRLRADRWDPPHCQS